MNNVTCQSSSTGPPRVPVNQSLPTRASWSWQIRVSVPNSDVKLHEYSDPPTLRCFVGSNSHCRGSACGRLLMQGDPRKTTNSLLLKRCIYLLLKQTSFRQNTSGRIISVHCLQKSLQHAVLGHDIVRPDPINGHNGRIVVQVCEGLQNVHVDRAPKLVRHCS